MFQSLPRAALASRTTQHGIFPCALRNTRPPLTPRSFHTTAGRHDGFTFAKTGRLPEFSLQDKVIVVSGAGRGLGLVQSEALLEAGAKG